MRHNLLSHLFSRCLLLGSQRGGECSPARVTRFHEAFRGVETKHISLRSLVAHEAFILYFFGRRRGGWRTSRRRLLKTACLTPAMQSGGSLRGMFCDSWCGSRLNMNIGFKMVEKKIDTKSRLYSVFATDDVWWKCSSCASLGLFLTKFVVILKHL